MYGEKAAKSGNQGAEGIRTAVTAVKERQQIGSRCNYKAPVAP